MTSEPFLKPRLTGARFEGGEIPLEVLADFAVLAEMIVEVAKWKYKEEYPSRKRVPRGFTESVSLKLTGVEPGSAIPIISLAVAANMLVSPSRMYFTDARDAIIRAIGAAEQGKPIDPFLPPSLLGYFDRFGRNLNAGETIEFTEDLTKSKVTLTKETRRRLVLASSAEVVTEEVNLYGSIPEVDLHAKTFQILTIDGTKVRAPLTEQHLATVMEAINHYRKDQKVSLYASGDFSRENRLQGIESVEHISILDPRDVAPRVEELKLLKAGWLDGAGVAPDLRGLEWLADAFDLFYPDSIPLPCLFPTPEGHVLAEWSLSPWSASLDIDLVERRGEWHILNVNTDVEETKDLNLTSGDDWKWLSEQISTHGGEPE